MTFEEYMAARQHLAEERIGTRMRERAAEEDAAFEATRKALEAI
jgi:hypothetical protein